MIAGNKEKQEKIIGNKIRLRLDDCGNILVQIFTSNLSDNYCLKSNHKIFSLILSICQTLKK